MRQSTLPLISLFLVSLLLLTAAPPLAQAASGPQALDLAGVATVEVPSLDVEALLAEDEVRRAAGLPMRFAMPHKVELTPAHDGTWHSLDASTQVWRLRIQAPGATSLNLGFDRFWMPEGGRLHISSADGARTVSFDSIDNAAHGELWTPLFETDDLVVEVTLPTAETGRLQLRLAAINSGYRDLSTAFAEKSGSCNVDVECPEGDGWRGPIRSVARITISGAFLCTGFLVNNTALDQTPYFLTADHCGLNVSNASTLVAYWNYHNSTCRPPGSTSSGSPGDGPLDQFQTGSTFVAGYSPADTTLLELDEAPDEAFGVYFAGWDRSSDNPSAAVAIHHPRGEEKRISFENDPVTTTSYLSSSSPGDGTHIRVADWDLGTTEGGSSGSPLFNPQGRAIGMLHGGFAACGNNQSDWYGRISVAWTGGGSAATRLSDWLDPTNSGLTSLGGLDPDDTSGIFGDGFELGDVSAWSSSMP